MTASVIYIVPSITEEQLADNSLRIFFSNKKSPNVSKLSAMQNSNE